MYVFLIILQEMCFIAHTVGTRQKEGDMITS